MRGAGWHRRHAGPVVASALALVILVLGCADDTGQATGASATAATAGATEATGTGTGTDAPTGAPTTGEPAQLSCGDGELDPDETCDDGNLDNSDACLNSCVPARCGDGFVQLGVEACDDGNSDDSDACTRHCEAARCGDGFVQLGAEECDDGNAQDDDGCTSACVVGPTALCGNGVLDPGEACDDGNLADDDDCPTTCVPHACGDGFVHAVHEECDDANDAVDDACVACIAAVCGDGFVHAGVEACDDGNAVDTDDCLSTCAAASCGDGLVHAGVEACDDGSNDGCYGGCDPGCAALGPRCGDGVLDADFETCDDGNTDALDGCDASCQLEAQSECLGYIELGEPDRHVTFNDGPGKVTECDTLLGGKWYRFVAPAGTLLATTLPDPYACGTDAPGYMLGDHPTVEEGIVERQVCFAWQLDCDWQTVIKVRNCGEYHVYRLADPPEVCLRYCGAG